MDVNKKICELQEGLFVKHIIKYLKANPNITRRNVIQALLKIANVVYGEERWVL